MKINAPVVNIKLDGDDLWFVRSDDNVLHQVRDIAALGPGHAKDVDALVVVYPNATINVPDDCVRFKDESESERRFREQDKKWETLRSLASELGVDIDGTS